MTPPQRKNNEMSPDVSSAAGSETNSPGIAGEFNDYLFVFVALQW
jgi:hypothetical protein